MSTRKSILFAFLSIVTLCVTALLYAAHKVHEDKLPSPFVQHAEWAMLHETAREAEREREPRLPAHVDTGTAPEPRPAVEENAGSRQPIAIASDDEIPLPPGGIQVAVPPATPATPAELGYSPQAQYDAEQFNNETRYAPQYDQYGQQVIEPQGATAASGVVYDPYYGYGYGFGYGPVTNYGQAPLNGQAYMPGRVPGEVQAQPQALGLPISAEQQERNFGPAASVSRGPATRPAAVPGQPPVEATPNGGAANSAPAVGAVPVPPVGQQFPPPQNVPPPLPPPARPVSPF